MKYYSPSQKKSGIRWRPRTKQTQLIANQSHQGHRRKELSNVWP
jgi:hypothetical protein